MSVSRQANILGQQRLDVPHVRAIESSIAADFDLLAGTVLAGSKALVVKGFDIVTTGAIGSPATALVLNVAGGVALHPLAAEHGTIFSVPADQAAETLDNTNPNVSGAFTAGQVNYVGLDLRRNADSTTADLVMFMNAGTSLETPKTVPLARTLNYKIIVSTTDFSAAPNVLPIAKVTTNGTNTVTALEDARPMVYRLAQGGSVPNRYSSFTWPAGRSEITSGSIFSGGDKAVSSLKDWMDAVMTRLWEVGGGQYWYSATNDRELKLLFGQPVIAATQDNFQWTLGSQTLQWSGLSLAFGNSVVATNTVNAGSATLLDGQCLYVDLDRSTVAALTAHVADLTTLGAPVVPGTRVVIAWRLGNYVFIKDKAYEVGRFAPVASTLVSGTVKLTVAAGTPLDPLVVPVNANGELVNTATGGVSNGFRGVGFGGGAGVKGTGDGAGAGVEGIGGGTIGPGLKGTGGATGGNGVVGQATGTSNTMAGVYGLGSSDIGALGPGVRGDGSGTGTLGSTLSVLVNMGVVGVGRGVGAGVVGLGGATNAPGVYGEASDGGNGHGVSGVGKGTGQGGSFTGGASLDGDGVHGTGGTAGGYGGRFFGTGIYTGIRAKGGPSTISLTDGAGVHAEGGVGGGLGVYAVGNGTGAGIWGVGGSAGGGADGIRGFGGASGRSGTYGEGGANGAGIWGQGGTGNGIGVNGNATGSAPALRGNASNPTNVALESNGYINLGGAGKLNTVTDKYITPQLIVRAHGRFNWGASQAITLVEGININSVATGGAGGFRSVTLEHDIGTSLCIQITSFGQPSTMDVIVDSVSVSGGRTVITVRIINVAAGTGGDLAIGGMYLTVWSYN